MGTGLGRSIIAITATSTRAGARRLVQIAAVAACAVTLAACDKCHMPTWNPDRTPGQPLSCHDDTPVK